MPDTFTIKVFMVVLAFLFAAGCQTTTPPRNSSATATIAPTPSTTPSPTMTASPTLMPSPTPFGGGAGLIAFMASEVGSTAFNIYSVTSEGADVTQLTDPSGAYSNLAWSPDGSLIAFASGPFMDSQVLIMNVQTRDVRVVGDGRNPNWSPDGRVLAVQIPTSNYYSELWLIEVSTGSTTYLANGLNNSFTPDWSPDGQELTFIANAGGSSMGTFVINADGSNLHSVSVTGNDGSPVWSPDGKRIAFIASREASDGLGEVYVMQADGTGVTRLTSTPNDQESEVEWSPDGKALVFYVIHDVGGIQERSMVYIMADDGGGLERIAELPGQIHYLKWSPDGELIGFRQLVQGDGSYRARVYAVKRDGTNLIQLSPESLNASPFSWHP